MVCITELNFALKSDSFCMMNISVVLFTHSAGISKIQRR